MRPMLEPPGPKCLKPNYDLLLSTFAFKSNLRRYTKARQARQDLEWIEAARLRQLSRQRQHEKSLRTHQRTMQVVKAESWQRELEVEIAGEKGRVISKRVLDGVLEADRPPLEALDALSLGDRVKYSTEAGKQGGRGRSTPLPRAAAALHLDALMAATAEELVHSFKPLALAAII